MGNLDFLGCGGCSKQADGQKPRHHAKGASVFNGHEYVSLVIKSSFDLVS
jgi:hypothetical protein